MKLVKRNQKLHNPDSPLLIGDVKESDVVMEVMNRAILIHKLGCSKSIFYTCSFYLAANSQVKISNRLNNNLIIDFKNYFIFI